jgi:hypothetical protein
VAGNEISRLLAQSADRFLVEIAATLMARYRIDELKSGDVAMLITLLGKMGFSPGERGRMGLGHGILWGLRDAIRRTTSAPPGQITRQGPDPEARLSRPKSPQQRSDQDRKPVISEQDSCSFSQS